MDYTMISNVVKKIYGRGYTNAEYYQGISLWLDWYKGYVESVHMVKISNGLTYPVRKIYRLGMAKRVCEDWASSVMNEEVQIVVNSSNKKSSTFVQGVKGNGGVLGSNNFSEVLSTNLEQMFALGTSALVIGLSGVAVDIEGNVVGVSNDARIEVKSFNASQIIPLRWDNNVIKDCAFISEVQIDDKACYVLSAHIWTAGGYIIENRIIDGIGNDMALLPGMLPRVRTWSMQPLFYIFKTNIANNVDLNSPLGVSVYGNALDCLACCDIAYDACMREVITGQRIVMMNKTLLTTDDKGNPIPPQDMKQTYMQFFGDDAAQGIDNFIKEFHPTLNSEALDKELQNQLNILSSMVGLGTRYYNFDLSSGVTATEYVGERNDFIKNSAKMVKALQTGLRNLVLGILYVGRVIYRRAVDDNSKVDILVSDGVIEDDAKRREMDRQDVKDGIMSKAEYRAKWYGETPEEAERAIEEISKNLPISD